MFMKILLETTADNILIEEKLSSDKNIIFEKHNISSWDGQTLITYLVDLSPVILTTLVPIIIQSIRSKRHTKLIYKGVEVQGVSENTIKEILDTIIKQDAQKEE